MIQTLLADYGYRYFSTFNNPQLVEGQFQRFTEGLDKSEELLVASISSKAPECLIQNLTLGQNQVWHGFHNYIDFGMFQ